MPNKCFLCQKAISVPGVCPACYRQWEAGGEAEGQVVAVLETIPNAVRVHEEGGPENVFASLAVSVAKLLKYRG